MNDLFIPKLFYSVNGKDPDDILVMKSFSFYTYDGSLAMPPCSEDTIHYIVVDPIPFRQSFWIWKWKLCFKESGYKKADSEENP